MSGEYKQLVPAKDSTRALCLDEESVLVCTVEYWALRHDGSIVALALFEEGLLPVEEFEALAFFNADRRTDQRKFIEGVLESNGLSFDGSIKQIP